MCSFQLRGEGVPAQLLLRQQLQNSLPDLVASLPYRFDALPFRVW